MTKQEAMNHGAKAKIRGAYFMQAAGNQEFMDAIKGQPDAMYLMTAYTEGFALQSLGLKVR